MPIITPTDLSTHIYAEVINEITRADSTLVTKAIDTAIQETKMYLSRYDLVQLFGTDTVAPTITDEHLKSLVKDITCWHLIRLANVNVHYDVFKNAYRDAIKTLKAIMKGSASPDGWPYKDTTDENLPEGSAISWQSERKRENYF